MMATYQSAAFDCVQHGILLRKLDLYKFHPTTIKWISSYLSNRSYYVEIGTNQSQIEPMKTGVPQGSVLGPLLYTLFINEFPEAIYNKECQNRVHKEHQYLFENNCGSCGYLVCYADDSTYLFSSNDRNLNQVTQMHKLQEITNFLQANLLCINPTKTTIMEIMLRQKRAKIKGDPPTLHVPDENDTIKEIKVRHDTILLGGTIQNSTSWQAHP